MTRASSKCPTLCNVCKHNILETTTTEPRVRLHGSNSSTSMHAGEVRNMHHWVAFVLINAFPTARVLCIGLRFSYGHSGHRRPPSSCKCRSTAATSSRRYDAWRAPAQPASHPASPTDLLQPGLSAPRMLAHYLAT